ncbi:hypothetical protein LGV61_10850 [Desulfurispirillum indicum]|uniref:Uncharacterized protein n=1 Tax=Desulfurispirillum indicum (strain ATCC BAA-1389 / DSM 22839 / S5) TaxID=653733 RepID=E6W3L6_DESIS|nr:hypothetical protein [Desulfurispirillum indicum]ADU66897.1 hypothetical protein Selin_2177 [Desulfurispirillum indicum S5]UCZ56214.1 hypothetical protein LGV61_10850 [Desulfurispirillum indicum]
MKKVLYTLMVLCVFAGVNAYAAPLACNACHINISADRLAGGKAHPIQYEGLHNRMTNQMHGGFKNCSSCHDVQRLGESSSPGASLLGGSIEALGSRPTCIGCHNENGFAGYYGTWADSENLRLHIFKREN